MKKKDPVAELFKKIKQTNFASRAKEDEDLEKRIEIKVAAQLKKESLRRESLRVKNVYSGLSSHQIEQQMRIQRKEIEGKNVDSFENHHLNIDENKHFLLLSHKEMQYHFSLNRDKIDAARKKDRS